MKIIKQGVIRVCLTLLGWLTYPLVISYRVRLMLFGARKAILSLSQLLSMIPGYAGIAIRLAVYQRILDHCGMSTISFGVTFTTPNVSIGSDVYIGPNCEIGQASIGDRAVLGSYVCVLSGRHQHVLGVEGNRSVIGQGQFETISIGAGSWIGTRSIVAASVGTSSVIGVGSVVVKPIGDSVVAVGHPATVIKANERRHLKRSICP